MLANVLFKRSKLAQTNVRVLHGYLRNVRHRPCCTQEWYSCEACGDQRPVADDSAPQAIDDEWQEGERHQTRREAREAQHSPKPRGRASAGDVVQLAYRRPGVGDEGRDRHDAEQQPEGECLREPRRRGCEGPGRAGPSQMEVPRRRYSWPWNWWSAFALPGSSA